MLRTVLFLLFIAVRGKSRFRKIEGPRFTFNCCSETCPEHWNKYKEFRQWRQFLTNDTPLDVANVCKNSYWQMINYTAVSIPQKFTRYPNPFCWNYCGRHVSFLRVSMLRIKAHLFHARPLCASIWARLPLDRFK